MDLYDVVMKLVGPVNPVGETQADALRFENVKELTELVERLLYDVGVISTLNMSHEYSVKRAGKHCDEFLRQIGIPKE